MKQVEFFNDSIGYVAGLGMKKTIDKAQTWSALALPSSVATTVFDRLEAPTRNAVFASGGQTLISSLDGGVNWRVYTFPNVVTGISFVDAGNGFAVTQNGTMYSTIDSAQTWSVVYQIPNAVFNTVYAITSDTIFIGGTNIYATFNGGQTWYEQLAGNTNILDIAFTWYIGVAIGTNGDIWYTYNRGSNGQFANNAAVISPSLSANQTLACPGAYTFEYGIKNYGTDTLRTLSIEVSFGSQGAVDTLLWSGALGTGDSVVSLPLGTYSLINSDSNKITLRSFLPNGAVDENTPNDTKAKAFPIFRLSGAYTVGGAGADFATLINALSKLNSSGVCGNVVLNLAPGHYYNSTLSLIAAQTTGPNARVLFRSATGNPADVIFSDSTFTTSLPIVQLMGQYFDFEGITFKTFKSTPNKLVAWHANTGNFAFYNCRFESLVSSTTSYNAFSNLNQQQGTVGGKILFDGCSFSRAGIRPFGADTAVIQNCVFNDSSTIYINACKHTEYINNTNQNTSVLHILAPLGKIKMVGNKFYECGMTIEEDMGDADSVVVANNYFSGKFTIWDLGQVTMTNNAFISQSAYTMLAFRANSDSSSRYGFFNNIVMNLGTGRVMVMPSGYYWQSDYNVFYADDSIVTSTGTGGTTLRSVASLTGNDRNSYWHKLKVRFNDFSILPYQENSILDGNGTPMPWLTYDIDSNPRTTNPMDIGPHEITASNFDISIVESTPTGKLCVGAGQDAYVKLYNAGSVPINNFVLGWSWNGNIKPPVAIGQILLPGDTTGWILLGDTATLSGVTYNLQVWVDAVNGTNDQNPYNDTLKSSALAKGLAGSYTIAGTSPNYVTLQAAIQALITEGVCDSVTFILASGVHSLNADLNISAINGSSANRPVRFVSANQDSSSTIVQGGEVHFIGSSYVSFHHIGFNSSNLVFEPGAHHIRFGNCMFGPASGTGGLTIKTENVNSNTPPFHHIGFADSYFRHAHMQWSRTSNFDYANSFENNEMYNCTWYMLKQTELEFVGNYWVDTTIGGGMNYGASFALVDATAPNNISGNYFYAKYEEAVKIWSEIPYLYSQPQPSPGNVTVLANNLIQCDSGEAALYIKNAALYHNTIRMNDATGTAINSQEGGVWKNNIFSHSAGGVIAKLYEPHMIESDYNVWHGGDTLITTHYITIIKHTNLNNWFFTTGNDEHSINHAPSFVNPVGYTMNNEQLLDGMGQPLGGISTDIEGNPRNPLNPDPGAWEFTAAPSNLDAAIVSNFVTASYCPNTSNAIQVSIKNFGITVLDSVALAWSINGVQQPGVVWRGNLATDSTALVTLGSFNFPDPIEYTLHVTIVNVNAQTDNNTGNDTISARFYLPLSGSYTVFGANAQFTSLVNALNYLINYGICGPTTLNVRPGVYNISSSYFDQPISGSSQTNTIKFQSETLNAGDVTLNGSIAPSMFNHLVLKHITFSGNFNLAGCEYAAIDSCIFTSGSFSISGSTIHDTVTISNNSFLSGEIYATNNDSRVLRFLGNKITSTTDKAVDVSKCRSLIFDRNTIVKNVAMPSAVTYGLIFDNISENAVVSNNLISGEFYHAMALGNLVVDYYTLKLFNNVVMGGLATVTGISVNDSRGLGDTIAYNTVRLNTNTTNNNGNCFNLSSTRDTIRFFNNIMANYSGGTVITHYNSIASDFVSDHNVLFTTGDTVYRLGNHIAYMSLADLSANFNLEANSLQVDPQFISPTDLHYTNPLLDGTAIPIASIPYDQQDSLRDAVAPNPGAYEVVPPVVYDSVSKDLVVKQINNDTLYWGMQNLSVRLLLAELPQSSYYYQYQGGIDTVYLAYSVNDTFISTETLAATLMPGDSLDFTFNGQFNVPKGRTYKIKVWAWLPSRYDDISMVNDTARKTLSLPMAGVYTVYGASPDFANIKEASNCVDEAGTSNTVTIAIRPVVDTSNTVLGLYGSTSQTPVIYRSETGNVADVLLRFSNIIGNFVHIEDITIKPFSNTVVGYSYIGIEAKSATDTRISGCTIIGNPSNYYNAAFSFRRCFGTTIENCTFLNLKSGVCYSDLGDFGLNHFTLAHRVENCVFDNVNEGIIIQGDWGQADSLVIRGNTFSTNAHAILGKENMHHLFIENNTFNNAANTAVDFDFWTLSQSRFNNNNIVHGFVSIEALVFNNVQVKNNMFSGGLGVRGTNNTTQPHTVEIINNSIYNGVNMLWLKSAAFYNNAIYSEDLALYVSSDTVLTGSNNTIYFITTPNSQNLPLHAKGHGYTSLSDMETALPAMVGLFNWADPMFISINDLHLRTNSPLIGAGIPYPDLLTDIDGDTRDASTPDVGADEFTTPPVFYDAKLLPLVTSVAPCTNGDVAIRIMNNGTLPVTTAEIRLTLNGIPVDTLYWTGNIQPNDTTTALPLSNISFQGGQAYGLLAYLVDDINQDPYAYNDTVTKNFDFDYDLLLAPTATLCGPVQIGADTIFTNYLWSTGQSTDSIIVSSSGAYSLTVSDQYGCIIADTVQVTTIPPVDVEVWIVDADCGLANGSIELVPLSGTAPFSYSWYPGIPQGTTTLAQNLPSGYYLVEMEDLNGCRLDSFIVVNNSCQDVWPGDANTDGTANVIDFVYITIGEGYSGPTRNNASLQWVAQPANNWSYILPPANLKHLDTDGNGTVALDDSMAIIQNYGLGHNKTEPENRSNTNAPSIFLKIRENNVTNGQTLHVDVYAGEASLGFDSIYATALFLSYDGALMQPVSHLDVSSSWFGSNTVALQKPMPGKLDLAFSKRGAGNLTGHGMIGTIEMTVPLDFGIQTPMDFTWSINIDNVFAFDDMAQPVPLNWYSDSITINAQPVGILEVAEGETLAYLYPNPASHYATLSFSESTTCNIQVFDVLGNLIEEISIVEQEKYLLDISNYAAGHYEVRLTTANKSGHLKLIKLD